MPSPLPFRFYVPTFSKLLRRSGRVKPEPNLPIAAKARLPREFGLVPHLCVFLAQVGKTMLSGTGEACESMALHQVALY
jgi:hypothetical protein